MVAPRKTWKQKLTKALLKHVETSTQRGTLAEVKRNIAHHRAMGETCIDCQRLAEKLGL